MGDRDTAYAGRSVEAVRAELKEELQRRREYVVVLAADGVTPLDVVTDANFHSLEEDEANGIGVLSSFAIDRSTGQPYIHLQRFPLAENQHVRRARNWRAALRAGAASGDSEMLTMHRWLSRRVLEAEQANPKLRELKDQIAAASRESTLPSMSLTMFDARSWMNSTEPSSR
jgi:hypothetical protein